MKLQTASNATSAAQQRPGMKAARGEHGDRSAVLPYYGPQLPVQWAPDKKPLEDAAERRRRKLAGDSGDDSPTEEVFMCINVVWLRLIYDYLVHSIF